MQRFSVWAPYAKTLELVIDGTTYPMTRDQEIWSSDITPVPGMRYGYRINGTLVPDPCSESQPDGVHGLSQVIESEFQWQYAWEGQQRSLIYELHVGTFGGDFRGVEKRLPYLQNLGVGAIELMPVQPFAGDRNWGYDGVFWHAVQESYGGALGLKKLVDAAHGHGIAVYLDLVYNHFGPEGNYTNLFGPYTVPHATAWGDAINLTNPHVRQSICDAAYRWLTEFHIDGFRLDATHTYIDITLLDDLAEIAREVSNNTGIPRTLIAEDLRDSPDITNKHGIDLQWNDTIHHCIHSLITGENHAYYEGYGSIPKLVAAINHRYPSVIYTTTHDQVGNRPQGDRPSQNLSPEQQILKAAIICAIPSTIMLFMGEEYGAQTPFPFFCSHTDLELQQATREGRKELFKYMGLDAPTLDPTDTATFEAAKLDWNINHNIFAAYQRLLKLHTEAQEPVRAVGGKGWIAILGNTPLIANLSANTITLPFGGSLAYSFGNPVIEETSITLNPWEFAFCEHLDLRG